MVKIRTKLFCFYGICNEICKLRILSAANHIGIMKIRKGLICMAAVIAATLMVSCQKDNTIQYNNATMGNIVEGKFISDQGNIFNVVDQQCIGDLQSMNRAFVVCDVLNRTAGGSENEYDVRVNQIATVVTKDPVYHTEVTEAMMTQDPVHVENAWIAGGYINMLIMFPIKAGSTTGHLINLVHEGCIIDAETEEEIPGTYRFTLRHNSNGDKITSAQAADYVIAGGYVSFPLSTYITEKEADFMIGWTWHKNAGAGLSSEMETKSLSARYTSEGFQHAPKSPGIQVTAVVK
jgi:hypothetical protein